VNQAVVAQYSTNFLPVYVVATAENTNASNFAVGVW
jgi:hypothetical protein